jgi:hypothetical protein
MCMLPDPSPLRGASWGERAQPRQGEAEAGAGPTGSEVGARLGPGWPDPGRARPGRSVRILHGAGAAGVRHRLGRAGRGRGRARRGRGRSRWHRSGAQEAAAGAEDLKI